MAGNETVCAQCGARNRVPVVAKGRPRCAKCRADLPWLVDVAGSEFDEMIRTSSLPVLIDLWAPWCGPCRAVAPALAALSVARAGRLRVAKVNVDDHPGVSAKLGVQGIPTMVLYADGSEVGRQVGALPGPAIERWVDGVLGAGESRHGAER